MELKIKRLNIEIPERDLQRVKIHAIHRGLNLKQYVLQALALMILEDEKEGF